MYSHSHCIDMWFVIFPLVQSDASIAATAHLRNSPGHSVVLHNLLLFLGLVIIHYASLHSQGFL